MSLFDHKVRRPSSALLLLEGRALLEMAAYFQAKPLLRRLVPTGDGHPVLIIPGFLAGDGSTNVLRSFLWNRQYAPHRWELGRNLIFNKERLAEIQERAYELKRHYGVNVSVIGWSLGGLYARELARAQPEDIRQVITLGSPFARNLKANNAQWLYRLISGQRTEDSGPRLDPANAGTATGTHDRHLQPYRRGRRLGVLPGTAGGTADRECPGARQPLRPGPQSNGAVHYRRPAGPAGRTLGPLRADRA